MMFGLTRIAICALFLCADHTVRGLDETSPVFHDVASADEGSNEPIIGDSMKTSLEAWNWDTRFYNKYYKKCLGFNGPYGEAEWMNCDDIDAHFGVEKLRKSYWKIRWNVDECVGVTKKKKGRTLSLMDCDEDKKKIVWVLPDVDEYGSILLSYDSDYCVRGTKLSKNCFRSNKKSSFKHIRIEDLEESNIHIKEIA
mmetsp:Transcript_45319/g.88590  ORF Transcript_45319/g.88590 Transcript_45319/m.88590 type:complete len:197 (+) Transcript_45319:107-697(+)|eukprot:CAMPEP_0194321064 /NCGR_PEP_ID=MMETSP0171-20130528/17313_1 /TAXON_ID=218684 /ORGANISM="Corethron pennatum, Strain L29A3" /LENGTH=196 /DNA_ID=CAMNT_0039078809 /DNA_START=107 /DNA_END=697 /DNA_ORIENTATION=+